jgi:hypothetical protein
MPTLIDECLARIQQACVQEPIDWGEIRGATLSLDSQATTKDQKLATEKLKRATDKHQVYMAAQRVERAFLDGKPDADGRPRRF